MSEAAPEARPTTTHPPAGRRLARVGLAVLVLGLGLGGAWAIWSSLRRDDPARLRSLALADFQAGRFDRAEAALARLNHPTADDWLLRAKVAVGRSDPEGALMALGHVPDDHREAARARLEEGHLALERHRLREAEAAMLHALKIDPELDRARLDLAYLYAIQLRHRELDAQFREIAQRRPLTSELALLWTQSACGLWDAKEVAGELEKAIAADPDDLRSRPALAEALRRLERPAEAEAVLKPMPDANPDAKAVRVELALDRGSDEVAGRLLADAPADHPTLARLGARLALARGDVPGAVRGYRAAEALAPHDRETLAGLLEALKVAGDEAGAKAVRERIRQLDGLKELMAREPGASGPGQARHLRDLGAACEVLGLTRQARVWYQGAIALDPVDAEAQRGLFRLKSKDQAVESRP